VAVTNRSFGKLVDCNHTMVSKMRHGTRLPSGALLTRIVLAFNLDPKEALVAYSGGPAVFGEFLDRTVFGEAEAEDKLAVSA
jgi:hypothetical protein